MASSGLRIHGISILTHQRGRAPGEIGEIQTYVGMMPGERGAQRRHDECRALAGR